MLENFNEDKRKNSMTQFSDFHTGWSIFFEKGIFNHFHPNPDTAPALRALIL